MGRLKRLAKRVQSRIQAKAWPDKSIVFYTGGIVEPWSPRSLEAGIGGAQTRIIYLAREWVSRGYPVTVFNNCGSQSGVYDGVQYRNYQEFNQYDTFDTLIIWHCAWMIRFPIRANRVWLDLGKGVLLPQQSEYEKLKHYDKIFCKNEFHRSTLPEIPDQKIAIISNGIDEKFSPLSNNHKANHKLIYASNYIRGLEHMLEFGWPIIRSEIPDAELHIYYGWGRNLKPDWQQKMMGLLNQPGVFEHGKVGKDRLMQEKSTAAIHYYGCTFKELDCNSVRESAFVGCVPVTTDYAGLSNKRYCVKVSGHPYAQSTQEALAQKIVELLKQASELQRLRSQFIQEASHETWPNVADAWLGQM
jgi:glycosyltransferase involved in cell wall biosynthesis